MPPTERVAVKKSSFVWIIPLVTKVDFQILPIFCLFYLFSSLDRSSVEFSNISGLSSDLKIDRAQSQWAMTIYYLCVIVFDLPSSIILRRWRPSYWFGLIMGAWGIISVSAAACTNFNGLIVANLLASTFEAGFFPCVIYYLSYWYTRQEFGKRVGLFWSCRCLAGSIGGLFAYGVSHLNSKQFHVWQWTYILQGAPCVVLALITSWYLPDNVKTAGFLLEAEKTIIKRKLEEDFLTINYNDWSWDQVGSVFFDLKVYAYILLYLLCSTCLQGVTLFLPTVITHLSPEKTSLQSQLFLMPPYLLAAIATIALMYSSDRLYNRSYHAIAANVVSILALIVLLALPSKGTYSTYVGHYIVTCILIAAIYAHVAVVVTWMSNNFVGFTRRSVAIGTTISIGSIGGAAGSQLFRDPENQASGKYITLVLLVIQTLYILMMRFLLHRETVRRTKLAPDDRQYQMYKFGGLELAHDRHPDFHYTL